MKKLLFLLLIPISLHTNLYAEVINSYHPKNEPAGLYIVDLEVGDSYSMPMTYRVYCPTSTVRNITNGKWGKSRKVYDEDRIKHNGSGIFTDGFNQVCKKKRDNFETAAKEYQVKKKFLIVKSTKNYDEARRFAKNISRKTGIRLNLRGLNHNRKIMLTASRNQCQDEGFEYPCYVARGRFDDGVYISIEYSGAYENFRDGYYIVVVDSGNSANRTLRQIKNIVRDAYVKSSKVYMGCIH